MYLATPEAIKITLIVLGMFVAVLAWVLVRPLVEMLRNPPQLDGGIDGSVVPFLPPQASEVLGLQPMTKPGTTH